MDQETVVDEYKKHREHAILGLGRQIMCRRDGEFLASVKAPGDAKDPFLLLSACIPTFYADEAVIVAEAHARHVDSDEGVPIEEDPNASHALLFVFSDRAGLRSWRLAPYGVSDKGEVEWRDFAALTTPEVDELLVLLDEVYAAGDLRSEQNLQLMILHANSYAAFIHRRAVEGS